MAKTHRPRHGSLQFYPRKRAEKFLPSVNWSSQSEQKTDSLLGFITYKVAMATALLKDSTEKVSTSNKRIFTPVTILEAPPMKIFSIRFIKDNLVAKEVIVSNDKELKKKVKVPKTLKNLDSEIPAEYDDIRVIAFSVPKAIGLKKTPDLIELGISASDKLTFVKSLVGKEITLPELFNSGLIDVRGLTRGKGLVGPVKRFGISLKSHKSEKGVRRPGSLAPWHPARVTFRTPMAGQLGMFSRVHYNLRVLKTGNASQENLNPAHGFKHYGKVSSNFLIVKGSVQGPSKRQILITPAMRPSKETSKKKLEFIEVIVK